ncbi:glycosyltransferase family 2 protein [Candidatus Bathyarchaeota archaeon]|nr:glycosyltransferase family 2 protein [Candidatus Bathyarchaeota archaeon]
MLNYLTINKCFSCNTLIEEVELTDKISIFIPVFRESQLLKNMLDFLIKDSYKHKEIIVCVDEPSENSIRLINEYPEIKFILSSERRGKVTSLNEATTKADGKIYLFLDSDLLLDQKNFLNKIYTEISTYDLLEIKKKILEDSFLARNVYYDFLSGSFLNWYLSKQKVNFLWLNGSAFAIYANRFHKLGGFTKIVSEDFDMAIKAYKHDLSVGYSEEAEVLLKVNPSWKAWYKQRQRWAIGVSQWFLQNWSVLTSKEWYLKFLIPMLINLIPFFLGVAIFLMPNLIELPLTKIFLLLSLQKIVELPIIVINSNVLFLVQSIFSSLFSFIFNYVLLNYAAKKLGYIFKPIQFIFFFFIYSLLLLIVNILSVIKFLIKRNNVRLDWKV